MEVKNFYKNKAEKVLFSAFCRIFSCEERTAQNGNKYLLVRSERGIRFVCFTIALATKIEKAIEEKEKYSIEGKLSFVPGSTFLVIESLERKNIGKSLETDEEIFFMA